MKKISSIILVVISVLSFNLGAQTTWKFDTSHSKIRFNIPHMVISEIEGSFGEYDGTITTTKDDFSGLKATFKIDVASIDTDNAKRDNHLKAPDFFDVAKYPSITFESTSVKPEDTGGLLITGNLTMHGVTKEVTFNGKHGGTIKDPWGNTKAGFKISGALNRKDWGLVYNSKLETGGLMIGENVTIVCNFELIKE